MAVLRVIILLITVLPGSLMAQELSLGASPLATYVDNEGEPAKLNAIVTEAFKRAGIDVRLQVMRRAFLGSALTAGQLEGEYAFIDLDDKRDDMRYSKPYLPLRLYAASKLPAVTGIRLIPQLKDSRIAAENRFANTTTIRAASDIKWSRNPSTYDAFRQFADGRAPYLLTSRLLIDEFNRLLAAKNEEKVHLSGAPLFNQGFFVSVKTSLEGGAALVDKFDASINEMQNDGTYNKLLGLPWLIKDIDGDGVGDYISTTSVMQNDVLTEGLTQAYPLDNTLPGETSRYYIDGEEHSSLQAVNNMLSGSPKGMRVSYLDADVYARILQRW